MPSSQCLEPARVKHQHQFLALVSTLVRLSDKISASKIWEKIHVDDTNVPSCRILRSYLTWGTAASWDISLTHLLYKYLWRICIKPGMVLDTGKHTHFCLWQCLRIFPNLCVLFSLWATQLDCVSQSSFPCSGQQNNSGSVMYLF